MQEIEITSSQALSLSLLRKLYRERLNFVCKNGAALRVLGRYRAPILECRELTPESLPSCIYGSIFAVYDMSLEPMVGDLGSRMRLGIDAAREVLL